MTLRFFTPKYYNGGIQKAEFYVDSKFVDMGLKTVPKKEVGKKH